MQSLFWVRQTGCKSSAQIGSMDCVTHSAARYDLWADSNCAQHTINITHLQDVQTALITLPGVGRKVADCVALFSLDQTACVPVDVHVYVRPRFCYIMPCFAHQQSDACVCLVNGNAMRRHDASWNIACRDFDRSLASTKSLTPTVYNRVGQLFESE